MASKTTNYNLTKPSADDFYDVGVQNGNMDIIDGELNNLNTKTDAANNELNGLNTKVEGERTKLGQHLTASNPHSITPSIIGLGNVNNTADVNKPVSTAQASAIADAKKAGTDAQSNLGIHMSDVTKHITASERTKWNSNNFELLKTQDIALHLYHGGNGNGTFQKVEITGVNFENYDELIFDFDGKVTGSSTTKNNHNGTIRLQSDVTESSSYYIDMATFQYTDSCEFNINGTVRLTTFNGVKIRAGSTYLFNDSDGLGFADSILYTDRLLKKTIYFSVPMDGNGVTGEDTDITGKLNIYGRKGLKQ